MSFVDCIRTAVETGRLTQDKANEAIAAFETVRDNGIAAGLGEDVAAVQAAGKALEEITRLKADKRWQRIRTMQVEHGNYERLVASKNLPRELDAISQEMVDVYHAVQGQLLSSLNSLLMKYMPRMGGAIHPIDRMDDIVYAIYGRGVGPEATAMAKATTDILEEGRKLLNLEGAAIPPNPNYRLFQNHDSAKIRQFPDAENYWVSKHMMEIAGEPAVDWDIMQLDGKPIPVDGRANALHKAAQTILTEGDIKLTPAMADNYNLATRLSQQRFIYYKTPEAWLAMQNEFGNGNFYEQLLHHVDAVARNVSIMRTFGPNPRAGKLFVERVAEKETAKQVLANPKAGDKLRRKILDSGHRFDAAFAWHSRDVDNGTGSALVTTISTAQTWTSTAVLGQAIISNLSDAVYGMWVRGVERMPQVSLIPRYLSAVMNYHDFRQQMIDNGIAYESALTTLNSANRYNLMLEGNHLSKVVSDMQYRITGIMGLTQIGRGTRGIELAQGLFRVKDLKFDDIPFVDLMRQAGLTEKEWDLLRGMPTYEAEYYNFGTSRMLRPIDMLRNASSDAERDAANKMLLMQSQMVSSGFPQPNVRTHTALGRATPATEPWSLYLRTMAQLMVFPAGIHFTYWKKIWQAPTIRERLWRLGTFITYATAAGAAITQIKDVLNGKKPHPMNTKEFWIRAMLNGGAGGIIGDILYNSLQFAGSSNRASTPLGQVLNDIKRLTVGNAERFAEGKDMHLGADASRVAWDLFPFKVPGIKLVVERTLMDSILEQSDPAAYRRLLKFQREQEREQGQGYWWRTGGEPFE
jgi:hypothetical protein